ncbi:MAG: helix-turn-helix domain-containing protein [Oscillospiraceae bacterium]|nr:helix-turn-helix domain-containing protein [Oscillospiraceae bacterium]
MSFGDKLQALRHNNGLTQESFAEQLNVSRQAVSRWESSRGYPEMDKILYICRRYGVTLDMLFADELPARAPEENTPETAPAAESLGESSLHRAFSDFLSNLSPRNKRVGTVGILCAAFLLSLFVFGPKGGNEMMSTVWIGAIIVFGIAEAVSAGLISIWFVGGSLAGLLGAQLGVPLWLQIALFLSVSLLLLIATRPLARKMMQKGVVPTNADRVLGQTEKVTERIDNIEGTGAVYIDGKTWSARCEEPQIIESGEMVEIVKMEGVKLFVKKKGEK